MMFVILVESLLSFTINDNVFYTHEKRGFLKRTDISMFSESEKKSYFDTRGLFLPEIQERHTKRPILRTLIFDTDQNVLDSLVKRYDFKHYIQKKHGTYVSVPNYLNFSKIFSEITLVENIRNLNVIPYLRVESKNSRTFEHKKKHNERKLELSLYDDEFINRQKACFEIIQHPILTSSQFETGLGVDVYVTDSFVSPTHDDLEYTIAPLGIKNFGMENLADSYSYDDFEFFKDEVKHGVHVIGIIGAVPNNIGIVGMAPHTNITFRTIYDIHNGALLYSTLPYIFPGLNFITEMDGNTVNNIYSNSWGFILFEPYSLPDNLIYDFIESKRSGKGAILVFAAGNGADLQPPYITWYNTLKHTIVVGSVESNGLPSPFTSRGTELVVSALGSDIYSTISDYGDSYVSYHSFDSSYDDISGTSMAAPQITSAIAMVLEHNSNFSSRDIKKMLMVSAYQPNSSIFTQNAAGHYFSELLGAGVLNVTKLLHVSKEWALLPEDQTFEENVFSCFDNTTCPTYNMNGQTFSVNVMKDMKLETVQLVFDAVHPWVFGFEIILESPSGTTSTLTKIIPPETQTPESEYINGEYADFFNTQNNLTDYFNDKFRYSIYSVDYNNIQVYDNNFKFLSNAFLDESSVGEWKVHVKGLEISNTCNNDIKAIFEQSYDGSNKCNDGTNHSELVLCNPLTDALDCGTVEGNIRKIDLIFNGILSCTPNSLKTLFDKTGEKICTDVMLYLIETFEVTDLTPKYLNFICNCYDLLSEDDLNENDCHLEYDYKISNLLKEIIIPQCNDIKIQLNVSKLDNSSVQRCCGENCTLELDRDYYEVTN